MWRSPHRATRGRVRYACRPLLDHWFPFVHLTDAGRPMPRLLAAVRSESDHVIRRPMGDALLRMRAASPAKKVLNGRLVAWGPKARKAAQQATAGAFIYRPDPDDPPGVPSGDLVLCHSDAHARWHRSRGWAADRLRVVPDPVDPPPPVDRDALGLAESDFLWLLPADATRHAGRGAGLKLSVWAGALTHVLMRREGKTHRLLIPGDGRPQRDARRFLDSLGLPDLATPPTGAPAEVLAGVADAAVLSPTGPFDPWAVALVRAAALPTAFLPHPETNGLQVEADHVAATSSKPRHVVRAMLEVIDQGKARPGTVASTGGLATAAWRAAVSNTMPGGNVVEAADRIQ